MWRFVAAPDAPIGRNSGVDRRETAPGPDPANTRSDSVAFVLLLTLAIGGAWFPVSSNPWTAVLVAAVVLALVPWGWRRTGRMEVDRAGCRRRGALRADMLGRGRMGPIAGGGRDRAGGGGLGAGLACIAAHGLLRSFRRCWRSESPGWPFGASGRLSTGFEAIRPGDRRTRDTRAGVCGGTSGERASVRLSPAAEPPRGSAGDGSSIAARSGSSDPERHDLDRGRCP